MHRYSNGDCAVLAQHVAARNGWGVCVVGELDETDPDHTTVGQIAHAYAVRPDGALVDVQGAHPAQTAAQVAARWGQVRNDYPDAASADVVWDHRQWLGSNDWNDPYSDDDEAELAAHVAALVSVAYRS